MTNVFLATIMALGLNPDTPSAMVVTSTPMPTPTPVYGTPFVEARSVHPGITGMAAENPTLAAVMALGETPNGEVQVQREARQVFPTEPGIIGPVYLVKTAVGATEGTVGEPSVNVVTR